jgi:ABC-type branched-subunit amino acid transport system substrate-binding protein
MRLRRSTGPIAVLSTLALLLGAAGCAKSAESVSGDGDAIHLYGTDGNMSNSFGDTLKDQQGVLAGMKGTTPLTPLSDDFKRRLRGIDSTLTDFTYSAESYDAVVIMALAAEEARSDEGTTIAKYVNGVTTGGTVCETLKACFDLVHAGKDIAYRGVSVRRSGFTDAGEPSTTSYGTLNFGRDNHIDDGKTEFVGAGDETTQSKAVSPPPVTTTGRTAGGAKNPAPLKIGGLIPHTGALAYQGPPIAAAVKLGIKEVNEAGGVFDEPVEYVDGDDGTSGDVASAAVEQLAAKGVSGIVGPCCSGVSLKILPQIIQHGIVTISMSATSDALTKADKHGLYFRTAPPDILQAKALADIVMRDGNQRIAIVARDDPYGTGLQKNLKANLIAAGIKGGNIQTQTFPALDKYSARDQNTMFQPVGRSLRGFKPDAVVVIGFEESGFVIKAMLSQGLKVTH